MARFPRVIRVGSLRPAGGGDAKAQVERSWFFIGAIVARSASRCQEYPFQPLRLHRGPLTLKAPVLLGIAVPG